MNQKSEETGKGKGKQQGLKMLREERKETVQRARELMKRQNKELGLLKKELKKNPQTVPELSRATGMPSPQVLWYLAAMKKYGQVTEAEKEGAYFRYQLLKSEKKE